MQPEREAIRFCALALGSDIAASVSLTLVCMLDARAVQNDCMLCCSEPRRVRLRPCGHAACCGMCTIKGIELDSGRQLAYKCVICRAEVTTLEWIPPALSDGSDGCRNKFGRAPTPEPPWVVRLPTEPTPALAIAESANVADFLKARAAEGDSVAAHARRVLDRHAACAASRSSVRPLTPHSPPPSRTVGPIRYEGQGATAEEWAALRMLFCRAVELGISNEEAVFRMVANVHNRNFSAAHYMQMWQSRIVAVEGANAAGTSRSAAVMRADRMRTALTAVGRTAARVAADASRLTHDVVRIQHRAARPSSTLSCS